MLAQAAEEVPHYRRLFQGCHPSGFDLADLPVVTKAQIRSEPREFLNYDWRGIPHIRKDTGGTTGDPWRYPLDLQAWTHIYAGNIHLWERTGYRYGELVVRLGTPDALGLAGRSLNGRLRTLIERHDVSQTGFEIGLEASRKRVLAAGRRRAAIWYGYPTTLAAMADAATDFGLTVHEPRAVVTTAEMLDDGQRERIEEVFTTRVYDQYGCNDGGVLAQTCHRGRYHVAEHLSIVEILDEEDRPCAPGVEGDVVVTNLHNRTLPFLRYKVGDRAVLGDGTCPCGTPGLTLQRILGRRGDTVRLPDGRELSVIMFVSIFRQLPEVRRWQAVQTRPDTLKLRYEASASFDPQRLEHYVRQLCGDGVKIVLAPSEPIQRTPQGKHRVVLREWQDK